jgi:fatty acid desaturase
MKNDDLRADRDDLDDLDRFIPRAPAKRGNNLVMQVAAGVFLGGLALWLVQLGATMLYAKLMLGTLTFGG